MWNPFRTLHQKLDRILTLQENTMSKISDLTTQINDATNVLAAKLDGLVKEINDGNPADIAGLQAVIDRLKALGADPANPIPAPEPAPAPAPTT